MSLLTKIKDRLKTISWCYKIFDSTMYLKIRGRAFKERLEELQFYQSVIGLNNALIFDVGANVGNKSIIFSTISERVLLFEPDLRNIKILKARFENKSNIEIIDYALSSTKGTADYYAIRNDSAYNSLSDKHINTVAKTRNIINRKNKVIKYKVKINTLSFFIEMYGKPNYIKIDVEGHEKEVLFGLDQTVPWISFEANLPQFLPETLDIIDYLNVLSQSKYLYNVSINNKMELPNYITSWELKETLHHLDSRSLEIYCKLNCITNS